MQRVLKLTAALAVFTLGVLRAETGKIPHGTVELISAVDSIQPNSAFQVGLLFHLEPGWHIYWKNPGDSGQRPRLKWDLPDGLTVGDIEWPTPKRLPVGPLLDYGYEGQVLLPMTVHATSAVSDGSKSLKANLRVLVCRETCMPGKANLALDLPVRKQEPQAIEANRNLFAQANQSKPNTLPAGWTVSASQSPSSIVLTVAGGPRTENVSFIPAHPNQIQNSAPQHVTLGPKSVDLALKRPADSAEPISSLEGLLLTEEAGKSVAYEIAARVTAASPETAAGAPPRPAQTHNLLVILALAFGGGLILNLMPCVFPVLSIKILSLLDNSRSERKTIQISAAVYTLGVLFSFWILVVVLLALRAGGRSLGWGFQLQAPGFVAFLICLLFVLGLSLIGAFEIGSSLMKAGSGLTQRGKYSSSFFTGVLATVVATPCTAPLMGVAVGFALSQSPAVCVAVFTSMAIGLASPFLLLSFFPQLSGLLPRPGAWMETLKQMMSFLVFGTVIWLLWVLGQQVGVNQLAFVLLALLALSLAAWIAGRWPQSRALRAAAMVLGIGVTVYCSAALNPLDNAARQNGSETSLSKGGLKWEAFSPDKLANYRSSGKPVLVDFTAAWCLTCQVNDRVVFHSPQVEQRLNRSDIVLLRADWTSYDPVITEWLAKFGRSGIPFYIIYTPDQGSTPTTLPDGILTPSTFLKSLDKLKI